MVDDALSFRASDFKVIHPFTTAKNDDGESIKVSFQIPPEIGRRMSILIDSHNKGLVPYQTYADFARDAVVKWLDVVEALVGVAPNGDLTWYMREITLIRNAADIKKRREIAKSTEEVAAQVADLVRSRDVHEILRQLGGQIDLIERFSGDVDIYWQRRWKHALVSSSHVQQAIRLLESSSYFEHDVVLTLGRWIDEVSGKGKNFATGIERSADTQYRNGRQHL